MSNKPGSITLMQLTRFGDILQTIWAIKDIKSVNPELKINLIVRERFGAPLKFLLDEHFDNILYLNPSDFVGNDLTEGLDQALKIANSWESSVLVNLSFSNSSAYLASLIEANFKLGLVGNSLGATETSGSWSEYVYSTVMRGPLNPFSLIDVFRFILGNKERPKLPERNISGNQIVIHPFASQKRKTWATSKWGEIIFKLLKKNPEVEVLIVGAESDKKAANEIISSPVLENYKSRVTLECGTLSLKQLFETLKKSFLFCGHDSMVGHMASLAGVQSLTLSLGSVRPIETSPYGLSNYVLAPKTPCFPCFPTDACDDFKCHKDLSYQVVSECLQQLIDTSQISYKDVLENVSPLHLSTAEILQSSFSNSGLFTLNDISKSEPTLNELYRSFYKIVWLFMLEGVEEVSQYPKLNKTSSVMLEAFIPNLRQLFELAEFGKKYSRFILEEVSKDQPNIEYVKSCGQKIEEIDEMQILLGKTSPALNPIIDFFNIKKSKMAGTNLIELCTSSHDIYQGIGSFCDIMFDLIDKTLNEYKISNKTDSMKEAKE